MVRYDALWQQHLITSEGGKTREVFTDSIVPALREQNIAKTLFVGYSEAQTRGQITAIVRQGQLAPAAFEGETVQIVLDQTPFYAEAGGQIGDTGWLHGESGAAEVSDTQKDSGYWFHTATVTAGELRVGESVDAQIDAGRRANIQRNHTTTHLLHKALQMVLGPHVQQRGSLVAPDRLRFDFSHDKSLTGEETRQVEGIVNEKILEDIPVQHAGKAHRAGQRDGRDDAVRRKIRRCCPRRRRQATSAWSSAAGRICSTRRRPDCSRSSPKAAARRASGASKL